MRHIGITGTRKGAADQQVDELYRLLAQHAPSHTGTLVYLHHGDCVGVDAIAARMARSLGYWLVAHPPTVDTYRAWVASHTSETPRPYLDRNRDIVDISDLLIGCPEESPSTRSGTQYTIRYAQQTNTPTVVVKSDGSIERHEVEQ